MRSRNLDGCWCLSMNRYVLSPICTWCCALYQYHAICVDEDDGLINRVQEIPRCQELLHDMLELSTALAGPSAHLDTPVTLLRARATTLAFSLLPRSRDQYQDEDEDDDEEEEGEADPDVLPTILAYKDGELERNWIRVDWEIEASGQHEAGLEGLLRRYVSTPGSCLAVKR